ncbi:MAG: hypothetical protein AB7S26_27490 [Sandaracinaceae bacterium]
MTSYTGPTPPHDPVRHRQTKLRTVLAGSVVAAILVVAVLIALVAYYAG